MKSIINLYKVNFNPKELISNNKVEILITHQEFIKIIILENLTPLFIRTAAKGNAAYIGPAANAAIKIDKIKIGRAHV